MTKFLRLLSWAPILAFVLLQNGCGFLGGSFESAAALDRAGKSPEAIAAYQRYLQAHPESPLVPKILYRIAKNYEAQSDYANAIEWYGKIIKDHPQTDEELHAILDVAVLYHDKIKDPSKAMTYGQLALTRYLDNSQVRDILQTLVDARYQTANAFFLDKSYKSAVDTLDEIYRAYPVALISPDTRARVEYLADRSKRALALAKASVDSIVIKDQTAFNKSFEADFPQTVSDNSALPSPDGRYLTERKKTKGGVYYLYLAKAATHGDSVTFKMIPQTFGAEEPQWSPDGKELVYWRTVKGRCKLEETDVKNLAIQTLFYTRSGSLGIHPAYHPAGNKIVYVYANRLCLINVGDNFNKQLLKTNQKLDYTAELTWSTDGTMIRCRQPASHGKMTDEIIVLDVSNQANP